MPIPPVCDKHFQPEIICLVCHEELKAKYVRLLSAAKKFVEMEGYPLVDIEESGLTLDKIAEMCAELEKAVKELEGGKE